MFDFDVLQEGLHADDGGHFEVMEKGQIKQSTKSEKLLEGRQSIRERLVDGHLNQQRLDAEAELARDVHATTKDAPKAKGGPAPKRRGGIAAVG